MGKKNVDDYLTEGIYGSRQTKRSERKQFLGTIRERIVIALTKGQVMSDKGLEHLETAMKANKSAKLLMNGDVSHKFLKEEKALADKYNIPYTEVTNEEADTDIGAVLAYDYAIEKEHIFIDDSTDDQTQKDTDTDESFFGKIKRWFS
ncbi:MAG TPA: YueI family protein [Lentibacillus sp.]|uniref:YueI family protein n=1 Tax=Lentibacillus sp. TaxID=1925746 RepID=UPI002B4AE025|nr:YueI family protein [Lentibacillus sp.]HLR61035.1 YueI family protein [Lentibacillus sp.]